ncbi:MAG: Electron transfer flavoprotein domain, partial [Chloroflexota bacterium]|nr:Electron transfer flavoprotein domain [Chloroflexota bacterium]
MGTLWVVGEPGPEHGLARISAEAATLARDLAASGNLEVVGVVVAAEPAEPAAELATYLPLVLAIKDPAAGELAWSSVAAAHLAALTKTESPDAIFAGAGPDGRDLTGALSA